VTTLALVDDHAIFREALKSLIAADGEMSVVAEAGNAQEALSALACHQPDVLLIDVGLPGQSGLWLARTISHRYPASRMLGLSMYASLEHADAAFDAGMLGYAIKKQSPAEVLLAIRTVARGDVYVAPGLDAHDAEQTEARLKLQSLTRREREVFDLTVAGLGSVQIATQLSISRRTVETHRGRILQKLKARNAMDLVRMALRLGWLPATGPV
jgi:DNA-binding NarL/FixJ family response regulator